MWHWHPHTEESVRARANRGTIAMFGWRRRYKQQAFLVLLRSTQLVLRPLQTMAASQHLVSRFAQVSPGFAYQPTEKHDGYALKFPHETLLSPPPRPPSVRRPVNSPSHPLITNHDLPPEMCFLFRPPFKKHLHTYPLLKVVVESFSRALCSCHRTRILWPTDEHFEAPDEDYPDQMHAYYINALVSPVLNLLSQLRSPFIEEPLQLIVERLDDGQCWSFTPHPLSSKLF